MKQLSFRKYSLLGLVLVAASAVTAAVIPSKSATPEHKKFGRNGHIVIGGDNDGANADLNTCIGDSDPNPNCTSTATGGTNGSKTSGVGVNTSGTNSAVLNTSVGPND